jgi:hypothetical protein
MWVATSFLTAKDAKDAKKTWLATSAWNHGNHGNHGWVWVAHSFFDRELCESGEFFLGYSFIWEPPYYAEASKGRLEGTEITEGVWFPIHKSRRSLSVLLGFWSLSPLVASSFSRLGLRAWVLNSVPRAVLQRRRDF